MNEKYKRPQTSQSKLHESRSISRNRTRLRISSKASHCLESRCSPGMKRQKKEKKIRNREIKKIKKKKKKKKERKKERKKEKDKERISE